jgi:hypothetical protein
MPFKVSFPFGKKHPVLAVALLAFLEACTIWSIWNAFDRGVLGGRYMIVSDHPGFEFFEFFLAVRIVAAICLAALIIIVVRDAIARRTRKDS